MVIFFVKDALKLKQKIIQTCCDKHSFFVRTFAIEPKKWSRSIFLISTYPKQADLGSWQDKHIWRSSDFWKKYKVWVFNTFLQRFFILFLNTKYLRYTWDIISMTFNKGSDFHAWHENFKSLEKCKQTWKIGLMETH